jgi:hypothetical protein
MSALGSRIEMSSDVSDRTKFKRRLVLSILNLSREPSTRIHSARFDLRLHSQAAEFVSWENFASKYETVELGEMKFTQSFEAGIQGGPKNEATGGVTVSASGKRGLEETIQLKRRYASFTGVLTKSRAVILQQGAIGVDLTGSAIIDIELAVSKSESTNDIPVFAFKNLTKDGEPVCESSNEVSIDRTYISFPSSANEPIEASVTLTADVRLVHKQAPRDDDDATIAEGDDIAEYRRVTQTLPKVELVGREDLEFPVWYLQDQDNNVLAIQVKPKDVKSISFSSFAEADSLLNWLVTCKVTSIKGRQLQLPVGQLLTKTGIERLMIERRQLN